MSLFAKFKVTKVNNSISANCVQKNYSTNGDINLNVITLQPLVTTLWLVAIVIELPMVSSQ